MKLTAVLTLLLLGTACSTRPCVDGEKMSSGYFGSVRSGYDPCPQKCCSPGWHRGCACSARCPCVARHPKQAEP
jgi:hypothetical protein